MKRDLESQYDFTFKKAFSAIDDWNYGFLDQSNVKRFLRKMGTVTSRQELIGVLRRFDLDGDCKVNFKEFQQGMKSSLTVFGRGSRSTKSVTKLQSCLSKRYLAESRSAEKLSKTSLKPAPATKRPVSGGRPVNNRRRATELKRAQSKHCVGPNSNYYIDGSRNEPQIMHKSFANLTRPCDSARKSARSSRHHIPGFDDAEVKTIQNKKCVNLDIQSPPNETSIYHTNGGSPMRVSPNRGCSLEEAQVSARQQSHLYEPMNHHRASPLRKSPSRSPVRF